MDIVGTIDGLRGIAQDVRTTEDTATFLCEAADLIASLTKERDALRMALLAASALLPAVESDKVLSGTGLIKQLSDDEYIIKERARSLLPKDEK